MPQIYIIILRPPNYLQEKAMKNPENRSKNCLCDLQHGVNIIAGDKLFVKQSADLT